MASLGQADASLPLVAAGARKVAEANVVVRGVSIWYSRAAITLAYAVAGWPILRWYFNRLHDGSDEPLGLVAAVAALIFVPHHGWRQRLDGPRAKLLAWVLIGYITMYPLAPPLARAALWVIGLSLIVAPRSFALAWTALLLLSLPWVATVQFYLGYPLRCFTTQVAALLLHFGGISARGEATTLRWAGERVLIDAPCSGIQMLWTLLVMAAVLASAHRLGARETLRLFRWASGIVLGANSLRATILFCLEMRLWPKPPLGHDGVGLVLFAGAGVALLWTSERLARIIPAT